MSKSKTSPTLSNVSDGLSESLAFHKITDSSQIQFPNQDIYYVYRPPRLNANIFERFLAHLSLMYYKYLLHSGIYVMAKSERRIVNSVVAVSVFLSAYQLILLFGVIIGSGI